MENNKIKLLLLQGEYVKLGQEVEFQFGYGDYAQGVIVEIDEESEIVKIRDEYGVIWCGFADYVSVL